MTLTKRIKWLLLNWMLAVIGIISISVLNHYFSISTGWYILYIWIFVILCLLGMSDFILDKIEPNPYDRMMERLNKIGKPGKRGNLK